MHECHLDPITKTKSGEKIAAMRIVRIRIQDFRCIREAEIFPRTHNVLLRPNNVGRTAVLGAINLALNPEIFARPGVIDENDFFNRLLGYVIILSL